MRRRLTSPGQKSCDQPRGKPTEMRHHIDVQPARAEESQHA